MHGTAPRGNAWAALALLTLVYVVNFVDRQLIGILGQPMKAELGLSDTQLGLLGGLSFALFYTILGIPIARLADRRSRVTIISVSLALWSAMTALCGLARGFPMLLVARMGVGVGEAGCAPPSQSLLSDHFPAERRATALAIFSLGVPIGMLVGAIAGGRIAEALGWRMAFIALGLPGLLLAVVVRLALREPERGIASLTPLPLAAVTRHLLETPAFVHMAAGASLASFAGYGLTNFSVPLLVRSYGLPLHDAASGFGIVVGLAVGIGIAAGGFVCDRLRIRGSAGIVAATGTLVAAILFQIALDQRTPAALALHAFVPLLAAHLYFGPTYAVTVNSVGPASRATAIALLLMAMNAIGLGLGPLFVGALSDIYAQSCAGAPDCSGTALVKVLRIDLLVYIWASIHFALAAAAQRRARPAQRPSIAR